MEFKVFGEEISFTGLPCLVVLCLNIFHLISSCYAQHGYSQFLPEYQNFEKRENIVKERKYTIEKQPTIHRQVWTMT